jgi:hypothetical protein
MSEFDAGGRQALQDQASPQFLSPVWRRILSWLSGVLSPIAIAILFFAILTPVALVMRLAGRDPLRLRLDRNVPSYWLRRGSAQHARQTSMTRQF